MEQFANFIVSIKYVWTSPWNLWFSFLMQNKWYLISYFSCLPAREQACSDLMTYSLLLGCCCYTCCIRRRLRRLFSIRVYTLGATCWMIEKHVACMSNALSSNLCIGLYWTTWPTCERMSKFIILCSNEYACPTKKT